jgi:hypothetical protein
MAFGCKISTAIVWRSAAWYAATPAINQHLREHAIRLRATCAKSLVKASDQAIRSSLARRVTTAHLRNDEGSESDLLAIEGAEVEATAGGARCALSPEQSRVVAACAAGQTEGRRKTCGFSAEVKPGKVKNPDPGRGWANRVGIGLSFDRGRSRARCCVRAPRHARTEPPIRVPLRLIEAVLITSTCRNRIRRLQVLHR